MAIKTEGADVLRLIFIIILLTFLFNGCTPTQPGTVNQPDHGMTAAPTLDLNLLHGGGKKLWRITQYYVDGKMLPVHDWAADNVLVINANGTGAWIFGEVDRNSDDTVKVDPFTWLIYENQLIIHGCHSTLAFGNAIFKVSLSENELMAERMVFDRASNSDQTVKVIYQPAVKFDPGAGSRNLLLTSGLAKTWAPVKRTENGTAVEIPAWQLDDLILLCTDGTGYSVKGESEQDTADTSNNDFFHWTLADNSSVLRIKADQGPVPTRALDYKIVTLEDNLLVLESTSMVDGKPVYVCWTYIPTPPPLLHLK